MILSTEGPMDKAAAKVRLRELEARHRKAAPKKPGKSQRHIYFYGKHKEVNTFLTWEKDDATGLITLIHTTCPDCD